MSSEKDESYYNLVKLSLPRYPNLKYLCEELQRQRSASPEVCDIGRAALCEFGDHETREFTNFTRASELRRHLANTDGRVPRRRLFILEDIVADYVELVGKELLLDPLAFAEHLRDTTYTESNLRSNGPKLPSSYKAGQSFCIVYYEILRNLPYGVVDFGQIFSVSKVYRKIKNNFDNPDDQVGILARKATFWSRGSDEDWDGMNEVRL